MKLEARHQTSDILSQIDDTLFAVSNLSAKIAFENLFPTCEIGDEIAELFIATGYTDTSVLRHDESIWNSIGRQRNRTCQDSGCECRLIAEKLEIETLNQPFLFTDDEHWEYRCDELSMPENDYQAMMYSLNFFGHEYVKFEIDYNNIKPLAFNELHEEIHYDEDRDW